MFNLNTSATGANTIATINTNQNVASGLPFGTAVGISPLTSGGYTYTTNTTGPSTIIPTSKRCRDCNHAHLNDQCIEYEVWGAVTFVKCICKEYVPKDNLEYLEHLYDKKQRKEKASSL